MGEKAQFDFVIYTDGACHPNPGKGGWGYVVTKDLEVIRQHSGQELETTNNRMEFTAVIMAILSFDVVGLKLLIVTDSRLLMNTGNQWMARWKKRGWLTANKRPCKNLDLLMKMDELLNIHQVKFRWIKGHSGDKFNNLADRLAKNAIYQRG